jgi:hypothetical protein
LVDRHKRRRPGLALLAASALLAAPLAAAPGGMTRPAGGNRPAMTRPTARPMPMPSRPTTMPSRPSGGGMTRPGGDSYRPSAPTTRPSMPSTRPAPGGYGPPAPDRPTIRPAPDGYGPPGPDASRPMDPGFSRPIVRPPAPRPPGVLPPPGHRPPPGWRPPPFRPPLPPPGGWCCGYYPPPYYGWYDPFAYYWGGVAVSMSLVYIIGGSSQSSMTVVTQPASLPPAEAVAAYQPPAEPGAPASVMVDLGTMPAAARPSASTCLAESARQIGATGGTAVSISDFVDLEPGSGGYRFRWVLAATYPDQSRSIPAYCRATPDKVVELTFG